jgi:hypothetical protein
MKRAALFLLCLAGCKPSLPSTFVCKTSLQCTYKGTSGVCQPNGACSFQDGTCTSDQRYGQFSAPSLRNQCVPGTIDAGVGDMADGSVNPHDGMLDFTMSGDGSVPACPSFAFFCDDFESGNASKWTGSYDDANCTTVVDTVKPLAGTYALDATAPSAASNGAEAALQKDISTQTTGTLAVRMYLYNLDPLINYDSIIEFDETTGSKSILVDGDGAGHWSITEYPGANPNTPQEYTTNTTTPATGTWSCVELVISLQHTVQLWVDDVEIINHAEFDTAPSYDRLSVGVARADMAGYHTFVDDVAVANQRIGCE